MARKSVTITIEKEGRDKGKIFVITEMSAFATEEWASRVFFALMNAGAEIPDNIISSGLAGIAYQTGADFFKFIFSTLAKVPHYTAKPILDDLMACVRYQPGISGTTVELGQLQDDIEEMSTLLTLKKAAFQLHFDFFGGGDQSITV